MTNVIVDITTIENPYDSFMGRVETGVQIGQDPPLTNPLSTPTTSTTTTTNPDGSKTTTNTTSYSLSVPIDGPSYNSLTPNGNAAQVPVKSGGNVGDFWVQTFIKSTNWQSKSQGFWLDGPRGYAEFCNVF